MALRRYSDPSIKKKSSNSHVGGDYLDKINVDSLFEDMAKDWNNSPYNKFVKTPLPKISTKASSSNLRNPHNSHDLERRRGSTPVSSTAHTELDDQSDVKETDQRPTSALMRRRSTGTAQNLPKVAQSWDEFTEQIKQK